MRGGENRSTDACKSSVFRGSDWSYGIRMLPQNGAIKCGVTSQVHPRPLPMPLPVQASSSVLLPPRAFIDSVAGNGEKLSISAHI